MSELTEPANEATEPVRMHRVKYSISYKKNLGNFENVDVGVGLEADGTGNPSATLARVRRFVEENLETAVKEVTEALQGD